MNIGNVVAALFAVVLFTNVQDSFSKETSTPRIKHRFLVHDEGNAGLAYIDEYDPSKNWKYSNGGQTYWGLQLVGKNRVLLGTSNEVDIITHKQVKPGVSFRNNPSAIRLENGNTIRCYEGNNSRVVEEIDSTGKQLRQKEFNGMRDLRMATYTPAQTFLFASNHGVDEVNWDGKIIWHFGDPDSIKVSSQHICRALRMPNGNTIISTGYGARLIVVSKDMTILKVIGGKGQPGDDSIKSNYYAGFHVLSNGHYIVSNWPRHGSGAGNVGVQILEYDTSGTLVWSYRNANMYSSIQDIIILDSLDITKFHDERTGVIAPLLTTEVFDSFHGGLVDNKSLNRIDFSNVITSFTINGKLASRNGIATFDQGHQGRMLIVKDNGSYSKMIFCK